MRRSVQFLGGEINITRLCRLRGEVSEIDHILKINIGAGRDERSERLKVAVLSCIMSRSVSKLKEIDNGKLVSE